MRLRSISLQKLIILCLIISSIIPDIGIKFSTGGFTWTVYRLFVLLSIVLVFAGDAKVTLEKKSYITKWIGFMAFWSIYGLAFLFIGKYSDMHNGFIFLLNIKEDNSLNILAKSNSDIHAGNIVKETSIMADGNGGGSPTFAQGGGKKSDSIDKIIRFVEDVI